MHRLVVRSCGPPSIVFRANPLKAAHDVVDQRLQALTSRSRYAINGMSLFAQCFFETIYLFRLRHHVDLVQRDNLRQTSERFVIELQLSVQDLEIVCDAEYGEQAVELFRKQLPDVALFDVRMPDISGIAASRRRGVCARRARKRASSC